METYLGGSLMQVKLLDELRGPKNSVVEVYLKLIDRVDDTWYVIPSSRGYDSDNSELQHSDSIHYSHPKIGTMNIRIGERIPKGYTFIPGHRCVPHVIIENNKDGLSLLDKDY